MTRRLIPLIAVVFCAGAVLGNGLRNQGDFCTNACAAYDEQSTGYDSDYSSYLVNGLEVGVDGWDDYTGLGTDCIRWSDADYEWGREGYDAALTVAGTSTPKPASLPPVGPSSLLVIHRRY